MRFLLQLIQNLLNRFNLALTRPNSNLERRSYIPLFEKMDYTRMATLDLLVHEILQNNVNGEIAELGVYRGDFAKYLNQIFANRPLHLFDTFSGFDQRDVSTEKKNKFSEGNQDFTNTDVELVLSKMKNPEMCSVHKGFFPDTTLNLTKETSYAFVSIDADLYTPIYEGLKYFYPKLSTGGYIFVHDFNNKEFSGANKAVLDFCKENNVAYVPTADGWGSAVIAK